ncbi:GNAT family N-acetyltransferase [Streptomyces zhihengii]|uniref:GNAT family N-acetyltransferase n=1 Tax=Streptomyces zhihengii TaxID=1818004 RepID=UPI003456B6C7
MSSSSSSASPSARATTDLTTDRLVLRVWTPAAVAAVHGEERLPGWADDFPAEGDRVVAGFLTGHPEALAGGGHRLIAERAGGAVVGSIGFFDGPEPGTLEVGYGVVASRRGLGYATEAARAVVADALCAPGVHGVYAHADLVNPASLRVLEKAGLTRLSDDGTTARFGVTAGGSAG